MHAFSVTAAESIAISSSFTINTYTVNQGPGAIPTNTVPPTTPMQTPATPTTITTVNMRFQDFPNVNITNSCHDAITLVEGILNDAITRFGR